MARATRGSDQFPLRLPDGLREQIKRHAEANGRSMNSEIVHLIEAGIFEADITRMELGLQPLREVTENDQVLIALSDKSRKSQTNQEIQHSPQEGFAHEQQSYEEGLKSRHQGASSKPVKHKIVDGEPMISLRDLQQIILEGLGLPPASLNSKKPEGK